MVPWFLQVSGSGAVGQDKEIKSQHHPLLMHSRSLPEFLWWIRHEFDPPSLEGMLLPLKMRIWGGFWKPVCGLFQVSLHPPANPPPSCCQLRVKELSPPFYIQKIPALMWEEEKGSLPGGKPAAEGRVQDVKFNAQISLQDWSGEFHNQLEPTAQGLDSLCLFWATL